MKKILLLLLAMIIVSSCASKTAQYDVTTDVYIHNHQHHPVFVHRQIPYIIEDGHHKKMKNIRYKNGHYKHKH